jgi:quercetin dioxygenase-like cupin family protein
MKRYRLSDLPQSGEGHIFAGLVPGRFLYNGGLGFKRPGQRMHPEFHTHEEAEVFLILQGRGELEINGTRHAVAAGDVLVVEPGEDHHLISSRDRPIVNVWLHAGPRPHPDQTV